MLKKYLEQISKIKIELIETKLIDGKIINLVLFGNKIPDNLIEHKEKLNKELAIQEKILSEVLFKSQQDSTINSLRLTSLEKEILEKEIYIKLKKIEFIKKVYDIEANKLDNNYIVKEELEDYDYYNEIFYGFNKQNLEQEVIISENKDINTFVSKEKLEDLLKFSKNLIPDLKWNFGNFVGLSHDYGVLNIPEQKEYNIRRVIVIFFHEMTHYFRHVNGIKNLGFEYYFGDYDSLEEGITGYNEYKYGNKIIDYGKHNSYGAKCYQVLLENISEEKKKQKFFSILKNKGFSKSRTDLQYKRYYRYAKLGGNKLFLKELIYSSAYNNVLALMEKDENNYEKIMAGSIGLFGLEKELIASSKNFDTRTYFNTMVTKIKKLI